MLSLCWSFDPSLAQPGPQDDAGGHPDGLPPADLPKRFPNIPLASQFLLQLVLQTDSQLLIQLLGR